MKSPLQMLRALLLFSVLILAFPSAYGAAMCDSSSSTNATDTLTDSGGSGSNYSDNESCDFLIQPEDASTITLTFSAFNLQNRRDFLTIYDGSTDASPKLANNLTGNRLPASVTSSAGTMLVRFSSNRSTTRSGFIADWTSTTGDICLAKNVGDNFPNVSYSQNSGSENWSGSWTEVGESDGVSAGIARVNSGLCTSGNCLRLGVPSGNSAQNYSNKGVYREIDLSGSTSATLSFVYRNGVNQGSQTIVLSVYDGSNWTNLQSYFISSTNTSPTS
ncbi:MAG: CUB domain-containing protein, partial [Colwellia sp.]|nr:CUB domain-containing protein [Colwellia sp.]